MFKALVVSVAVAGAAVASLGHPDAAVAGDRVLRVASDRLLEMELGVEIGTVMVANPAVADVAPVSDRRLVVIGRKPGSTGLLVFSKAGDRLVDATVLVAADEAWTVTVNRGAAESRLTCAPRCTPSDAVAAPAPANP